MKKKIVVGLGIYSVLLFLGGMYVLKMIRDATSTLDNLITLHQVEILREHYLIQIRRVQTDLTLRNTPHSRGFDEVVENTRNMGRVIDACFGCHHAPHVMARIEGLKAQTEAYEAALSRVLTVRANAARLRREEDAAFVIGEELIERVSDMIAMTGARLERSTQRALEEIDGTKYVLFVLVALVPLVSAALGAVFVSGVTAPLGVLLGSTRKLKGGDLDHRVQGLKDEFGELGAAFNEMAASLKRQMLRMQRTEQMAVLGKLSAGLAHEIKNPLAGIKVAMDVLSQQADLSEEDRAVVRKVGQEVSRLEGLMKSFLNFAKPPVPQPSRIQVNSLMNTTLAFYAQNRKPPREQGAVRIVSEQGDLPTIMADPMQLQQVFLNLVLNAMDAMPDGGTMTVRSAFEPEAGMIRVEVADSGKGIDPEFADGIFQPFFTTKHGGTGLGLAISQQLVQQHGGTITAGENPGGGAVFTVRLPVRPASGEEAA